MDSQPLVSVVLIIFNAERFLPETLTSVLAQTYPNWELLLVEDGSTDNSPKIARQYHEANPGQVRLLEHEGHQNRGMSASRNLGSHHARGDYVAFLDADDVWSPHTLAEQVKILESQPEAGMVYGPAHWWYSWTGEPVDAQRDFLQPLRLQPDRLIRPPTLLTLFLQQEGSKPCGMLLRRNVIAEVGGFEETFRGMYEDQVFCAKLCLTTPVYVSSRCWYKYRQHPDSCCYTSVRTQQYRAHRQMFLNWLAGYLSQQRVQAAEVWRALERELWPYRHPILHRLSSYARSFVSG